MAEKLSLEQSFDVLGGCRSLPNDLHSKIAYHLGRIDTFIAREHKGYVKGRDQLAEVCGGIRNKRGGYDIPTTEGQLRFQKEHREMLEAVIEIPFEKVKVEDLRRDEGSQYEVDEELRPKIAPSVQSALDPFLIYPEEKPAAKKTAKAA